MVGVNLVGCRNAEPTICRAGPKEARIFIKCPLAPLTKSSGSNGDNIVSHFAVNYHNEAAALGIDLNELYQAAWTDGEVNPPEWNIEGRQVDVYKYVPFME